MTEGLSLHVTYCSPAMQGLHMTYYGTGCIFHYDDDKFKEGNGVGFLESDEPNFLGSYYSRTKVNPGLGYPIQCNTYLYW